MVAFAVASALADLSNQRVSTAVLLAAEARWLGLNLNGLSPFLSAVNQLHEQSQNPIVAGALYQLKEGELNHIK